MQETKSNRRPRISLRTLLLLITIAAMGITICQLYSELVPLRVEVREHRDTLGIFKIEEPDKIHAIRIDMGETEDKIYKYRVHLPEGRQYYLCCSNHRIPDTGLPLTRPFAIAAGEHLITFRIRSSETAPASRYRLPSSIAARSKFLKPFEKATLHIEPTQGQTNSIGTVHLILGTQTRLDGWNDDKDTAGIYQHKEGVENKVEVFAQNDPIVLLKIRLKRVLHSSAPKYKVEPIPDPADGFMLWIQPKTEKQNPL